MRRIALTRDLAWASATDAGNANMRRAGRKAWSLEDRNIAADKFNALWTIEQEKEAQRYCPACEKAHESALEKFQCLRMEQLAYQITKA